MSTEFNKIAIVGRPDDERIAEPVRTLTQHLAGKGIELYSAIPNDGVTQVEESELAGLADLVVAVGGDGTMLHAGAIARKRDIPLLGINRGRLGFLADVTPVEMLACIDQVLSGNYQKDSRLVLEAVLQTAVGEHRAYAINDVVLQRRETGRMVDFETSVAGRFINTHSGDGLIVATPTGSTAYALSCGGPIIDPQIDAIVLVPIAPHTLTDRPIVIPSDQPVEIKLHERDETKAEITVDGASMGEIKPGDTLTIGPSAGRITLLHPRSYDYFEILRSKLFWGKDGRNRGIPNGG
ncbi:MAG: NAD(+)/NADH kinase [Pseudomonadota bacterium]